MQENKPGIQLFNESGQDIPITIETIRTVTALLAKHESCDFSFLEVVYVDEAEIVRINKEHLERDYVTDIITFRYDDDPSNQQIEGTLFCCTARIYEQSLEHNEDAGTEFKRVLIHGLLHLCGYEDSTPETKNEMTERENFYLKRL